MVTVHTNSEASSSSSRSEPVEPERMIVVVTGANTGVGLGICHRLLSSLSLPLDRPITESLPQLSAFAPSQPQTLSPPHTPRAEMTLTLILACRSLQKAQVAKEELLEKHFGQLEKRRRKGMAAPSSWRNGLRIEIELLDVDSPNGENGILDFCGRMKERYPYITSFYSNAGIFAATKQHWGTMCREVLQKGPAYTFSHSKGYMEEEVGRLSRDKKRGGVWGVNTFATYLLATELLPLLQQSPLSLPFSPRLIYTTSSTADISDYILTLPADLQLLTLRNSYAPSKYIGDLLINDFDRRHGLPPTQASSPRAVRAFSGEPGCLATMAGKESMASSPLFGIIQFANWLVFALMRLFGSPWHPRDTEDATAALLYAALVPDAFLPPVQNTPPFKFNLVSHPLSDATVTFVPVDGGETREVEEVLKAQLEECERIRRECRAEAGLDREEN